MLRIIWAVAGAMLTVFFTTGHVQAATKDEILKRGNLQCGVSTGLPGFSQPDDKGNWTGLDVEVCRAIAAATLGDATKVKFIPLTARERFTALLSGEVDLLSRNTSWTLTRDSSLGIHFCGISYYDGQGFMVAGDLGATRLSELDGATICIESGTTSEHNLADHFQQNDIQYTPILFDTPDQAIKGFESGRCKVITGDLSQLYGLRLDLTRPENGLILSQIISKEPLGPVVRQGDDAWFNIVRWTLYAMINGEELGVTSLNIDILQGTSDPALKRLLGQEGIKGEGLGLSDDWAYQIIKQVGNYGEIFERTVGQGSPLKIDRGLNSLWIQGGLHYAPPIR